MDRKTFSWLIAFGISMALLESAVVVYLRALYYPTGFTVALRFIDEKILFTELLRELATIVMLLSIGVLVGKNKIERFAYFLFSFAVWDIFYYVWLKVLLDWPESLFTWDILFLIPITWLGPVLAAVICSITMIVLAVILIKKKVKRIMPGEWALLIGGTLVILFTFMFDYGKIMFANDLWSQFSGLLKNPKFLNATSNYIPDYYLWELFWLGEAHFLLAIYFIYKRNIKEDSLEISFKAASTYLN